MNKVKVLLSLLAGISVGTIIGILIAPQKGTETRKKIKDRKNAYLNEIEEKFENFMVSISSQTDHLKDSAHHIVTKGKAMVEDAEAKYNAASK